MTNPTTQLTVGTVVKIAYVANEPVLGYVVTKITEAGNYLVTNAAGRTRLFRTFALGTVLQAA